MNLWLGNDEVLPLAMAGHVNVVGTIWMPSVTAAYTYTLSGYDVENMRGDDGKIARREIEDWLAKNAGDFASIEDFEAEIGTARYGWKDEESEFVYSDLMYGSED